MPLAAGRPAPPRKTIAGIISAALVGVFLVAGWWPFRVPKNNVSWLPNANGLWLHHPATLWSSAETGAEHAAVRSLEIWLQPDDSSRDGRILAFQTEPVER